MLDNFEQVAGAAPAVSALLAACPRLKVLATSRARLHLRGEQTYPVPPLTVPPLPDDSSDAAVADLLAHGAVALFTRRAREADPDFALSPANAAAVVEICRRLDGLPLAIELAAARIRLLPGSELLARLARPLQLLAGGPRDVPARQRSLREAIDWSYTLLSGAEQALFARLAIFSGGASLAAVEAVCADDAAATIQGSQVADVLTALIEQSLVRRVSPLDAPPRLSMLATLHDYARERLEAGADLAVIQERHAAYIWR